MQARLGQHSVSVRNLVSLITEQIRISILPCPVSTVLLWSTHMGSVPESAASRVNFMSSKSFRWFFFTDNSWNRYYFIWFVTSFGLSQNKILLWGQSWYNMYLWNLSIHGSLKCFPSIATKFGISDCYLIYVMKISLNFFDSIFENTEPKVSWLGILRSNGRNCRKNCNFAFPNSAISTKLSAPQMTAQRAARMTSRSG